MSVTGKSCKCDFCGEHYEIDWNDQNKTHQRFCGGDCQYAGEVLPSYIRTTTGQERKHWEEELSKINKKLGRTK